MKIALKEISICKNGAVAQMEEHFVRNEKLEGSSPFSSTTNKRGLGGGVRRQEGGKKREE